MKNVYLKKQHNTERVEQLDLIVMLSHRWLYVLWWLCVVVFPQPVTCPDIFCYFHGNVRFSSKRRLNFVLVCRVLCIYVVLYCPWPWFKVALPCTVIFSIAKSFCWSSFPDCYIFVDCVQLIFQSLLLYQIMIKTNAETNVTYLF